MRFVLVLFVLVAFLGPKTALAQTDAEKFAEGRIALDKFKDCEAAYKALSGVSEQTRKEAMWLFYMGKATECLKKYDESLCYYRAYSKLVPPNAELLDKIGELQYQADKRSAGEAKLATLQTSYLGKWEGVETSFPTWSGGRCQGRVWTRYDLNFDIGSNRTVQGTLKKQRYAGITFDRNTDSCYWGQNGKDEIAFTAVYDATLDCKQSPNDEYKCGIMMKLRKCDGPDCSAADVWSCPDVKADNDGLMSSNSGSGCKFKHSDQ